MGKSDRNPGFPESVCSELPEIASRINAAENNRKTDSDYSLAEPRDKPYKINDGHGLYMWVTPRGKRNPEGGKVWRYRFEIFNGGKWIEKTLTIGHYPDVSLVQARRMARRARELRLEGFDPTLERRAKKDRLKELNKNSFESIAREWAEYKYRNRSAKTGTTALQRLEKYAFPYIGKRPVATLSARDFLTILRRIEGKGHIETARRLLSLFNMVMRYAMALEIVESNPADALRDVLAPLKVTHLAAVIEPAKVGDLLRAIDCYGGDLIVKTALRVIPYIFVRPGELRHAKWKDINWEKNEWRYTTPKTGIDHIVPFASQVVDILTQDLKPVTGNGVYLFPGGRTSCRPISDMAMTAALRTLGYNRQQMTAHGFRAMARTLLDEELEERPEYIEQQLAHTVRDPLGTAYNRTTHLAERKRMMQRWADYLDALKAGHDPATAKAMVSREGLPAPVKVASSELVLANQNDNLFRNQSIVSLSLRSEPSEIGLQEPSTNNPNPIPPNA